MAKRRGFIIKQGILSVPSGTEINIVITKKNVIYGKKSKKSK